MLKRILDIFLPQPCLCCGEKLLGGEKYICVRCFAEMPRPMMIKDIHDNPLARRFWGKVPIESAASAFTYQPSGMLSKAVAHMKYFGNKRVGKFLGEAMANELIYRAAGDDNQNIFAGADVIVPLPITKERKLERGFNQSELLCRGIAEVTGIAVETQALKRIHFAGSQTTQTAAGRAENVRGAFQVGKQAMSLAGKHVILLDDIITTGATVTECLDVLRQIPDIRLSVLSLGWTHD